MCIMIAIYVKRERSLIISSANRTSNMTPMSNFRSWGLYCSKQNAYKLHRRIDRFTEKGQERSGKGLPLAFLLAGLGQTVEKPGWRSWNHFVGPRHFRASMADEKGSASASTQCNPKIWCTSGGAAILKMALLMKQNAPTETLKKRSDLYIRRYGPCSPGVRCNVIGAALCNQTLKHS